VRPRRHVRRPPDLTSLFDVLFIVVFAALIRAAAVQNAAEKSSAPAPAPSAPVTPPAVAALRQRALADLGAGLAARNPVVVRITRDGVVNAVEADGKVKAIDAPLLEHSPDPDVVLTYLGDRSAELRVCRIAALHLGAADLSRYLVIIAPAVPIVDLPTALIRGLRRDLDRCLGEQRAAVALVDPSDVPADRPASSAIPLPPPNPGPPPPRGTP
jgi:hypothetical protein